MKTAQPALNYSIRAFIFFLFLLYSSGNLISCINAQQLKRAGMHHFVYQGEEYRIRTIVSGVEGESRNELIGKKFLAVDLDQDCRIDRIQMGEVDQSKAQEIYNYCIESLIKDNKLKRIERQANSFQVYDVYVDYEIISYKAADSSGFNEFRLTDKQNPQKHIEHYYYDQQPDGILDEIAKGDLPLPEAQTHYSKAIEQGLKSGEMQQRENKVFVHRKSN